jgi:hypothetical protein
LKTIPELHDEIDTQFPTNATGQITAAKLRTVQHDLVDSLSSGGTFTGTGDPGLTAAQVAATTFTTPPTALRTTAYSTLGDVGGGLYVLVGTQPSFPGYIMSTGPSGPIYYQLVPEHGEINIAQFGAIPMINHLTQPADGATDDSYAAFVAADKYIANHVYGSVTPGGLTLRIPAGIWYISKMHQLKRKAYDIRGGSMLGTYIRYPAYGDAFGVSYTWSCGRDYTVFGGSSPVIPGMYLYKTNLQASPGNVYVCTVGGTLAASGDPLIGSDPTATYTHGTAQFKYVKNVGPTSAYDYDITSTNFAENSSIENMTLWSFWDPASGNAPNNLYPDQKLDIAGQPVYNCGIIMRARARCRNLVFLGPQGYGIAIIANGDRTIKGAGNTNGWELTHIVGSGCGKALIHVSNSDGNAGSARHIDSQFAGRMGMEDFSFLGNNWTDTQSDNDGSQNSRFRQYPGGALYNGFGWRARLPTLGIELWPNYVAEEPGGPALSGPTIPWIRFYGSGNDGISAKFTGSITGNTLTVSAVASGTIAIGNMIASAESVTSGRVRPGTKITAGSGTTWTVDGATQTVTSGLINAMGLGGAGGGEFPDWTPTKVFEPTGAWGSNSVNARNRWSGMYIEGGSVPAQPGPRDTVIGGLQQGDVDRTRGALILDDNAFNYLKAFGVYVSPGGGSTAPGGIQNFLSSVTLGGNGDAAETILQLVNYEGHTWAFQHINGTGADSITGRDIVLRDNTGPGKNVITFTGHNTAKLYGGSAGNTMPSCVFINDLVIGNGTAGEDGRPVYFVGQAPTSGYHRKGTLFINDGSVSTATGQPAMWSCTAEGSPGTFKIISVYP